MNKKVLAILVVAALALGFYFGFTAARANKAPEAAPVSQTQTQEPSVSTDDPSGTGDPSVIADGPEAGGQGGGAEDGRTVDEDGSYDQKDDVALYIHTYGHLPHNYVTKQTAKKAGWKGGSVDPYFEGFIIGGDVFGNREGLLPKKKGRTYYECDIDTFGKDDRGAKRIVYSDDGLIYYTDDHYESFTLLYGEE